MLVLGIDAGTRNLGVCLMRAGVPEIWRNEQLLPDAVKSTRENGFKWALSWCRSNTYLLHAAKYVVLERQRREPFVTINTVIRTLYADKALEVAPQTLCSMYKLPRTRAEKKKATIELVEQRIGYVPDLAKKDDVCDAALLAFYALDKYGKY